MKYIRAIISILALTLLSIIIYLYLIISNDYSNFRKELGGNLGVYKICSELTIGTNIDDIKKRYAQYKYIQKNKNGTVIFLFGKEIFGDINKADPYSPNTGYQTELFFNESKILIDKKCRYINKI